MLEPMTGGVCCWSSRGVGCGLLGLLVVMLKEETGKKLDSDLAHSPVSFLSYLVMGVKQGR